MKYLGEHISGSVMMWMTIWDYPMVNLVTLFFTIIMAAVTAIKQEHDRQRDNQDS